MRWIFATSVDVPGAGHDVHQIGPALKDCIVYRGAADQPGESASLGRLKAHQPHDVAQIIVERQAQSGLIAPDIRIGVKIDP